MYGPLSLPSVLCWGEKAGRKEKFFFYRYFEAAGGFRGHSTENTKYVSKNASTFSTTVFFSEFSRLNKLEIKKTEPNSFFPKKNILPRTPQ
jgi:hypothetical protein